MLLAVLLLTFAGTSLGHVVPTVPGDNSHYVEGESRYIWMPNGEGVPVLVDLQEPVDVELLKNPTKFGSDSQYWLYTRQNPTNPDILDFGSPHTIWLSNFSPLKETKIIVHGWNNDGNSEINTLITTALLTQGDVNVIVIDWHSLANSGYLTAVLGLPSVGQYLGGFVIWLVQNFGVSWNNIHLVGYSLGAHIVGIAGRFASGNVRRVTGLDPAGPGWGSWNPLSINAAAGVYVEIIHTDAGTLGMAEAVGDADFYPNGGGNPQPGCSLSTCSHSRSYQLFAATVFLDHLEGRLCSSVEEAQQHQCTGSTTLKMGNNILNKWGSGIYYLTTGNSWPF